MPATRSRTEHWRDSLQKVVERGGALEISVDRSGGPDDPASSDVVWRCRLLAVNPDHVLIEPPAAFGSTLALEPGVRLIGAMTIGQNRWMFHTCTRGHRTGGVGPNQALMLDLPDRVERCTRRSFFRISTANLQLARVQCWPLIDPTSVVAPEAANRAEITETLSGRSVPGAQRDPSILPEPSLLPDVGAPFRASLLNVSGGGLGLLVAPEDSAALASRPFVWVRLDLRPHIPVPAAVTARVAHTHIDSTQSVYAGLAFDFAHNPSHRKFIVDLFAQYVQALQRQQRTILRDAA